MAFAFMLVLLGLFPESRPIIVIKTFRTKSWRPFYLRIQEINSMLKKIAKSGAIGQFCDFFQVQVSVNQ